MATLKWARSPGPTGVTSVASNVAKATGSEGHSECQCVDQHHAAQTGEVVSGGRDHSGQPFVWRHQLAGPDKRENILEVDLARGKDVLADRQMTGGVAVCAEHL